MGNLNSSNMASQMISDDLSQPNLPLPHNSATLDDALKHPTRRTALGDRNKLENSMVSVFIRQSHGPCGPILTAHELQVLMPAFVDLTRRRDVGQVAGRLAVAGMK